MTSKLFRILLAAFIVAISARLSAAQGVTVAGTVTSKLSAEAIASAGVSLQGPGGSQDTKTDAKGAFTFSGVTAGAYHLIVTADGFLESRTELTVSATTPAQNIVLQPSFHATTVISVSPEARSQLDTCNQPTSVLGGQDLAVSIQNTIGATLANQPGVAERSFGPGPSRPVIRGLDGDRVLVVENGLRMGDLSSQSGDHGVNVNPASASKIEVVRGPATLLYGANAIGGLVNVITSNIPMAPVHGQTGALTMDLSSASPGGSGAGDVTLGNGKMAFHVAGSGRDSRDYRSPAGTIPNSSYKAGYFEGGLSQTSTNGYAGFSVGYDRTHYGIPLVEEGTTNLNPRRKVFDFRTERRNLSGFFSAIRASVGVRRYRHDERDGDEVATSFTNNTSEVEVLAKHRDLSHLKGSIGASFLTRTFVASGEEVLSPQVGQKGMAAFLYEEAQVTPHFALQFGGRMERASFSPADNLTPRTFNNVSGSVGLLVHPNDATTFALSVARAARNPALEELYLHGPHGGNNAFENGDETLKSEQATGVDASFRFQAGRFSGEVTGFVNQISNFIFRQLSGDIVEELPESFFVQGNARLQGIESHVDIQASKVLWLEGGVDYVHGQLTSVGMPLPRMPPLRGTVGISYHKKEFQAGLSGVFTGKQDRIFSVDGPDGPVGETATTGYNLVKLFVAYSIVHGKTTNILALHVGNAGNVLYHNHLNYLKDLAPEVGRDIRFTYTVKS